MRHRTAGRALVGSILLAASAFGGATTPTLTLATAAGAVADGGRTLSFTGAFDFENALQLGYPVSLLVFQGAAFVRYPLAGPAVGGSSGLLADSNCSTSDAIAVGGQGSAAQSTVRILTITPTRLRVTLPASFTTGTGHAVVVASLTEDTALSNQIDFAIP